MGERQETLLRAIQNLLSRGEIWRVTRVLDGVHPADAAELVGALSEEDKRRVFEVWEADHSAEALLEMEESDQVDLAEGLSLAAVSEILEEMPADDAADLLGDLPPARRGEILAAIEPERAQKLAVLLVHEEDTAGGLMTPHYVALQKEMSTQEAIERLRELGPDAGDIYYIFVLDDRNRLVGVVSLRELIIAQPNTLVKNVMDPEVFYATVGMDQEEVARTMRKYDLLALPVVDDSRRLVGVVTVDDVMDVLEDEATEDVYRIAGTGEGDVVGGRILAAARARFPWLAIAILGETLIVGSIAGAFDFLLKQLIILIVFWPAITNLGGNVAVQAATIIVRGLATGQLDPRTVWLRISREVRLGLAMGLILGLGMGGIAVLLDQSVLIGVIVVIASLSVVIGGALTGTLIPILSQRTGVDPAITSPLLTVVMDAASSLIYFLIALAAIQLYQPVIP